MTAPGAARVAAPAKVNLLLRVLDRRPDGFHDLETLFQMVGLSDAVEVQRRTRGVALEVDGPDLGPMASNLAYRAADAFLRSAGLGTEAGVEVHLTKRIPAGAGLGGGSSDAAAVLRCMDALWPGRLPPERLRALALELGSDVPFFLGPSALALGRGRGERLVPIESLPAAALVLVLPPVHVATGGAYAALAGTRVQRAVPARPAIPDDGWDWRAVAARAENDFESVVADAHPEVAASLRALRDLGGSPVLLSGSGAACFGRFDDEERAAVAARSIALELGWRAVVANTLAGLPEVVVA